MSERAAIYVRVSTAGQEDGTSLQTQEAACRKYAADHGLTVDEGHVYVEVYTGIELWDRPGLTALRQAVRAKEVAAVVVYAIDRLSRDPVHLGVIISEAEHAGVDVQFVSEPLDNSPEGQLIRFVRGYAAKIEHEKIKERAQRGMLARVNSGKPRPARLPIYGYTWTDDSHSRYEVDPTTSPTLLRIWDEAKAGRSLRRIASGLNEDGIPSPSGGLWEAATVRFILHNIAYTGQAYAMRTKSHKENGKRRVVYLPREEWLTLPDGVIPPLVSLADYNAVQERLTANKARAVRNCHEPERFLLRGGYVRCGVCGESVIVDTGDEKHAAYYRCHSASRAGGPCGKPLPAIRTSALDEAVWSHVRRVLLTPGVLRAAIEAQANTDPAASDFDAVDRHLVSIAKRQGNLARGVAKLDADAAEPLLRELASLAEQKKKLEGERQTIMERRQRWHEQRGRLLTLEEWAGRVAANLDHLTYQQKRDTVLFALGVQVRLFPSDHKPVPYEIDWDLPVPIEGSPSDRTSGR